MKKLLYVYGMNVSDFLMTSQTFPLYVTLRSQRRLQELHESPDDNENRDTSPEVSPTES